MYKCIVYNNVDISIQHTGVTLICVILYFIIRLVPLHRACGLRLLREALLQEFPANEARGKTGVLPTPRPLIPGMSGMYRYVWSIRLCNFPSFSFREVAHDSSKTHLGEAVVLSIRRRLAVNFVQEKIGFPPTQIGT